MGYIPVQRDAGRIMYESAINRADILSNAITGISEKMYQRDQENKAFGAKLKSLESLLQTHKDKFGMSEEQVKQFLTQDPNQTPKERYLRIGSFVEDSIKMSQLEKDQAQMASMASENQLRTAQTLKTLAELQGIGVPRGQVMTIEDFQKLPATIDATAKPIPGRTGMVEVTGYNLRAPSGLKAEDLGGAVGMFDAQGNLVRTIPKVAQAPSGYEFVQPEPTAAPAAPAQAPEAAAALPPAAIAGPAILGRFMSTAPTRAVPKEALEAMQPTAAPKAEAGTRVLRPTVGGPVDIEQKAKAAAEQAARQKKLETLTQIDSSIDTLLKRVNEYSVGPGAALRKLPIAGKGTDAAEIEALLPQLRAQLAFDALKDLKASNTSLGQVAIKEIELLQSAIVALDQDAMKPETFRSQLLKLKEQLKTTGQRLMLLDQEYRAGRTEPSEAYYKLGGRPLEELNKAAAAPSAVDDPMKALEAAGFRRTKK